MIRRSESRLRINPEHIIIARLPRAPESCHDIGRLHFADVPILLQKSLLRSARSDSVGRAGDSLRGDR